MSRVVSCLTLTNPMPRPMLIMGYIPLHNRVYLADKDLNVYAYSLSLSVVEYQAAVLRGDTDDANEILPTLPKEQLNKVVQFLEGRGMIFIPVSTY
jgi:coatomer subunit beta'